MNSQQLLGFTAMQETITNGGAIDTLLNDLARGVHKGSADLYAGALSCILGSYLAVRTSGVAPRYADKDLDSFMQAGPATMAAALTQRGTAWDVAWLSTYTGAIAKVVDLNRTTLKFSAPVAVAAPAPEPMPVRVIGMPERVTESSISYDSQGNIKATKQTEKDAT
jgi:hypothetical protein